MTPAEPLINQDAITRNAINRAHELLDGLMALDEISPDTDVNIAIRTLHNLLRPCLDQVKAGIDKS